MSENVCPQCGAPIDPGASECRFCGEKIVHQQAAQQMQQPMYQQPQPIIIQQAAPQMVYTAINPAWPVKSKVAAGVLAIFLGALGVHHFYLGKIGTGLLCLMFCWSGIPTLLGIIDGITILCSNDENFQLKYHVRI